MEKPSNAYADFYVVKDFKNVFCRIENSMRCGLNETKKDTVVSIEDGVRDISEQRMEVTP